VVRVISAYVHQIPVSARKRRWRARTPRPAGLSAVCRERESVVECGTPVPLLEIRWESGAGARALQDLPVYPPSAVNSRASWSAERQFRFWKFGGKAALARAHSKTCRCIRRLP